MNEEVVESAKAIQEVAKTAKEAINITEKLGNFLSGIIHEPADIVVGILTDRLKYMRWTRQIRLLEQMKKIITEKKLSVDILSVPPKIALPIIENATLEEDDYIQDMWAKLFIESGNINTKKTMRVAYIDVIKQLEKIDAEILKSAYLTSFIEFEKFKELMSKHKYNLKFEETDMRLSATDICEPLRINYKQHEDSFDNLFRLRLLRSNIDNDNVDIPEIDTPYGGEAKAVSYTFSHDEQYNAVCITKFGFNFVKICLND